MSGMLLALLCALAMKIAPATTAMATRAEMVTAISVLTAPAFVACVDADLVHRVLDAELHELDVGPDEVHCDFSFVCWFRVSLLLAGPFDLKCSWCPFVGYGLSSIWLLVSNVAPPSGADRIDCAIADEERESDDHDGDGDDHLFGAGFGSGFDLSGELGA